MILHCPRLGGLGAAADNEIFVVALQIFEHRKNARRDWDLSGRSLTFGRRNNNFSLTVTVMKRHTLNRAVDGQNTFFEVNVRPHQTADLAHSQSHCKGKSYADRDRVLVLGQIFRSFLCSVSVSRRTAGLEHFGIIIVSKGIAMLYSL